MILQKLLKIGIPAILSTGIGSFLAYGSGYGAGKEVMRKIAPHHMACVESTVYIESTIYVDKPVYIKEEVYVTKEKHHNVIKCDYDKLRNAYNASLYNAESTAKLTD